MGTIFLGGPCEGRHSSTFSVPTVVLHEPLKPWLMLAGSVEGTVVPQPPKHVHYRRVVLRTKCGDRVYYVHADVPVEAEVQFIFSRLEALVPEVR